VKRLRRRNSKSAAYENSPTLRACTYCGYE
jgi:hypothetical protein